MDRRRAKNAIFINTRTSNIYKLPKAFRPLLVTAHQPQQDCQISEFRIRDLLHARISVYSVTEWIDS
jgi:hypothetical protein